MRISYSSLEAFQKCPLKFKFSEIDDIGEPKGKEAVFGNYLHEILKWFYEKDPHFPDMEKLLDYYYRHWSKNDFSWNGSGEEKDYFQEGLRILESFYKNNLPAQSSILDLETKFEVVIEEKEKNGKKHILSGIIDRIDKLPDGRIEIIDYKTGKRIASQKEADNNLQLSLYALAVKNRWPKISLKNISLSLYFLKFNEKIETKRTEENLLATEEKIIELIHKIQKSKFEPKPSPLCRWCGYQNICPVWRHLFENNDENNYNSVNIEEKIDEYFLLESRKEEIENKLNELKNFIEAYISQTGLKRVFGKNGYFSQITEEKISFNKEKIRDVLSPLGKWEEVIEINAQKIKKIIREIPPESREEIEKAKKIEKIYDTFLITNGNKKDLEEELEE
ncbi:MAG: PD-(D/E)XK nuclease family protein [Candidatus Pacebacteria bacterium]|nr:PD-(D/E)XK nuclease family protein [Candidatus Paceibacterota bacterium]